jgi:hypothetical protein
VEPNDFVILWQKGQPGHELVRIPPEAWGRFAVPRTTIEFLASAGLPESAAPFLSFGVAKSGHATSVAESWQLGTFFERYVELGSTGSGDPLALDTLSATGAIYVLNHDADFAPRLLAGSVQQLAELLLKFRDFVADTIAIGGQSAYLDGRIPSAVAAAFKRELERIDPAAATDSIWVDELPATSSRR